MRVLMFGWEFPPRISGGLGTACFGMTEGLADMGAEILFVMPRPGGRSGEPPVKMISAWEARPDDVPGRAAPSPKVAFRTVDSRLRAYGGNGPEGSFHPGKVDPWVSGPGHSDVSDDYGPDMVAEAARYGRRAGRIAMQEAFDVIHGHDWMTVPAGIEARRLSGRPYIYHVHALEFDRSGENIDRRVYEIERRGLESADHVISVSGYTKNMIVERYGILPDRVTVIHNAVSRPEGGKKYPAGKPSDRKIVLFLGRVTFQKGPDIFIEAASRVLKAVPDAVFVMAGSGDRLQEMIDKVARLKMGRHVHFTGFLRGEDVERIYAMSAVYVMPSVSEPFGISPLEAMVHGVPVILSKQSGVSEIIHHALKADVRDANEWADRIIAVLTRPALGREMTKRAAEELASIHWKGAAEKIMAVYRRVCG